MGRQVFSPLDKNFFSDLQRDYALLPRVPGNQLPGYSRACPSGTKTKIHLLDPVHLVHPVKFL